MKPDLSTAERPQTGTGRRRAGPSSPAFTLTISRRRLAPALDEQRVDAGWKYPMSGWEITSFSFSHSLHPEFEPQDENGIVARMRSRSGDDGTVAWQWEKQVNKGVFGDTYWPRLPPAGPNGGFGISLFGIKWLFPKYKWSYSLKKSGNKKIFDLE